MSKTDQELLEIAPYALSRLSQTHKMGRKRANKADLEQLRAWIRGMSRWSGVHKLLRDELGALGYWRNRARGNPRRGRLAQQQAGANGEMDA